jgi:predicted AlkP superfamily phosphohydrolase/phosphomutase
VYRREEIYWGPYLKKAPDLIVQLADDAYTFDWYMPVAHKGKESGLPIVDTLSGRYAVNCGYHRVEGILMLQGKNIRKGVNMEPAQIYDVIPTALYLMGLPIPAGVDGQVLREAINGDLLNRRPVENRASVTSFDRDISSIEPYSGEESEAVASRLRDLGYL